MITMNATMNSSSSSQSEWPSAVVRHMHKAPRFGHSNDISLLAALQHDDQLNYARGILGFCIFLSSWFVVWMMVLLMLKFGCGVHRVGCAASGRIVDVQQLKAQGIRKLQRKRLILRSWRLQTTLLLCIVAFFITMVCWNKLGVLQVVNAVLPALQQINQSIQQLADQGFQIANSINRASIPLISNHQQHLTTVLLDSHHHSENCPLANQLPWPLYQRTIQVGLTDLTVFVNTTVQSALTGWSQVMDATQTMETILYQTLQHVYIVRAWMLVTSVFAMFLFVGVVLTLHYVVHPPLSCFLAYLILPMFAICMFAALASLFGLSALVLMNADFCAGGSAPGSAVGTMLEMMYRRGMQQNGYVDEAFIYYLNDCVTTSPFASTLSTVQGMENILETISSWEKSVNSTLLATFSKPCQTDISQTMAQLDVLSEDLQSVYNGLQSALDLSQCQNIYPILQQIIDGPICTTSIQALTWLWSTLLVMLVLAFIIFSCRAGLYNAIVRAIPKHGQLKYQQKEFDEYKKFMAEHYDDANEWKFESSSQKYNDELRPAETFDTAATTKPPSTPEPLREEDNGEVPLVVVMECCDDEEDVSQLHDIPIGESFELNATMVAEIENLGKGLDRLVKDLEALEESMDRAELQNEQSDQEEEMLLYTTPLRSSNTNQRRDALLDTSIISYSTLWPWRSRVHPTTDSMMEVDDTELKPLTPFTKPPMAPRKTRRSLPRTRNNDISS